MIEAGFERWEAAHRARLQGVLDAALPPADHYPARLHGAMRYATAGGKRLRGLLVYAAGEALGAALESLDAPAAAIELIHAYSLVHDDLPAMDDDALRRGRATVHVAYDEGTAILAGDALQTLAFELVATATALPVEARLAMLATLAQASGSRGMAGGQQADLDAEGQTLTLPQLEALHGLKTGALIKACLRIASAAASTAGEAHPALDRLGTVLGLGYQIQDDLLDVEGSMASLGKTPGKDVAVGKSTYVQLMGAAAARERVAALHAEALALLKPLASGAEPLRGLIDRLLLRQS